MSAIRWLSSPLAGTAGVLAGLFLISIPLRKLTSAEPVALVQVVASSATEVPAVLRIKTLAPAKVFTLKSADGTVLLDEPLPEPGESEHDVVLGFTDGEIDIILHADFGDHPAETAVFLTVMPDGREEQTQYAIGRGVIEETLHYDWPDTH